MNVIAFDQNVPPNCIPENQVTPNRIQAMIESAVNDCEVDEDGDVYVVGGLDFPVWVRILDEARMITFFTYYSLGPKDPDLDVDIVNEMNKHITGVQFHARKGRIWGQQWMSFDSGLNVRQLILTLRQFAKGFEFSVNHLFRNGCERA